MRGIMAFLSVSVLYYPALAEIQPLRSTQAHVPVQEYAEFKAAVRMRESSDNYESVSALGFLGAYQLGEMALMDLGYYPGDATHPSTSNWVNDWQTSQWTGKSPGEGLPPVTNREVFLRNPAVQDHIFDEWFDHLLNRQLIGTHALGSYLGYFLGMEYKGMQKVVEVTPTGMFMGGHLRGEYGIANYLKEGAISVDEFGTPITDYILEFERF